MAVDPSAPGTPGPPPPRERATTVSGGTQIIGTYEIDRLISAGGMGEVYRGHNIHNGEPVAIKIVLPSLAHDPKIVALFLKESTVLSRLSHEAIVRYHVFTNDPQIGRPCLVMEFVSGTPMSERIEGGPMPLEDVKVMLRRIGSGLDKAHRAGVVHRDLSPDNIILEEGKVTHAKLIDFGIAKSSVNGVGTLLQGHFAGKFNWVSPEQLGAFGGVVDGRSDIYSLALIAAAASRGGVLPMGDSIVDAVGKRAGVPDLTGVDPALVPLLSWMLNPDPGNRPESLERVIAALDNPGLVPVARTAQPVSPHGTQIGGPLPAAATVIATPPREDASPFGAAPVLPPGPAPTPKGKAGVWGLLALLVVAGGAAAAYMSGAFSAAPPVVAPPPEPAVVVAQPEAEPVEKPAGPVVAEPAPKPAEAVGLPEPPALLNPDTLRPLLQQAADCGPLALIDPPPGGYAAADPLRVAGRIATPETQAALARTLADVIGARPLQLDLAQLGPQFCPAFAALPSLPSGGFAVGLGYGDRADPNLDGRYLVGENPVIDITIPAATTSGSLSVVILDGSGQVIHLLPNANRPENDLVSLRAGQTGELHLRVAFSLGEAAETDAYRPAFVVNEAASGEAMVLVLHGDAAVAATSAPSIEPVASFAETLKSTAFTSVDFRVLSLAKP